MKHLLSLGLLLALSGPVLADVPISLGILPNVQTSDADESVNGLRINLVYSHNSSLSGIDWGVVGRTDDGMTGLQLAWVGINKGDLTGVQYNWLYAGTEGEVSGAQFGLWNDCETLRGLQWGFYSSAGSNHGLQLGLINRTGNLRGVQLGLINIADSGGAFKVFPILNWPR